jgi:hypothetical protein
MASVYENRHHQMQVVHNIPPDFVFPPIQFHNPQFVESLTIGVPQEPQIQHPEKLHEIVDEKDDDSQGKAFNGTGFENSSASIVSQLAFARIVGFENANQRLETNTALHGTEIHAICKEALQSGWIKVSCKRDEVYRHLLTIASIIGMTDEETVRIKVCAKVAQGTNGKRNDCKRLQSMKDTYLANAKQLFSKILVELDSYSKYDPPKAFSVLECFKQSLENSKEAYELFSWKKLESDVYSKVGEDFMSERNMKRRRLADERNNKCRAFRELHLPKDDFKSSFGFDITRLVKGGSWGNAESKEVAVHLKAVADLVLTTKWIPKEHSAVRSAIIGAMYVVAAHGEHNPYDCFSFNNSVVDQQNENDQ